MVRKVVKIDNIQFGFFAFISCETSCPYCYQHIVEDSGKVDIHIFESLVAKEFIVEKLHICFVVVSERVKRMTFAKVDLLIPHHLCGAIPPCGAIPSKIDCVLALCWLNNFQVSITECYLLNIGLKTTSFDSVDRCLMQASYAYLRNHNNSSNGSVTCILRL